MIRGVFRNDFRLLNLSLSFIQDVKDNEHVLRATYIISIRSYGLHAILNTGQGESTDQALSGNVDVVIATSQGRVRQYITSYTSSILSS